MVTGWQMVYSFMLRRHPWLTNSGPRADLEPEEGRKMSAKHESSAE